MINNFVFYYLTSVKKGFVILFFIFLVFGFGQPETDFLKNKKKHPVQIDQKSKKVIKNIF